MENHGWWDKEHKGKTKYPILLKKYLDINHKDASLEKAKYTQYKPRDTTV